MSDQYIPMIERISEEYDESDSNMVLELADTDQGYAGLKQMCIRDRVKAMQHRKSRRHPKG